MMSGAYTINFTELTARGFRDTAAANYFATGGEDVVTRDVGVAECLATNDQLWMLLRKLNPEIKQNPGDRAALAKAIWASLVANVKIDEVKAAPPPPTKQFVAALNREVSNDRDAAKASGPPPKAVPKNPRPAVAPIRSPSGAGGQFIYPTDKCAQGNPRREGTHGWKSMKIILDEPGLELPEYFKRGGRPNDLKWDIEKGNVVLEASKRDA